MLDESQGAHDAKCARARHDCTPPHRRSTVKLAQSAPQNSHRRASEARPNSHSERSEFWARMGRTKRQFSRSRQPAGKPVRPSALSWYARSNVVVFVRYIILLLQTIFPEPTQHVCRLDKILLVSGNQRGQLRRIHPEPQKLAFRRQLTRPPPCLRIERSLASGPSVSPQTPLSLTMPLLVKLPPYLGFGKVAYASQGKY